MGRRMLALSVLASPPLTFIPISEPEPTVARDPVMRVLGRTLSRCFNRLYSMTPLYIHITIVCKLEVKYSLRANGTMDTQDSVGPVIPEEGPEHTGHTHEDETVQNILPDAPEDDAPLLGSLYGTNGHHATQWF